MVQPKSKVLFKREEIIRDLEAYGEEEIVSKYLAVDNETFDRISERAFEYALISEKPNGSGMFISKAICLAIVEVIEGKARPLNRKRRKYKK
jgi:hypothetical protein